MSSDLRRSSLGVCSVLVGPGVGLLTHSRVRCPIVLTRSRPYPPSSVVTNRILHARHLEARPSIAQMSPLS